MNWHQISVTNVFELYYPKRRAAKKKDYFMVNGTELISKNVYSFQNFKIFFNWSLKSWFVLVLIMYTLSVDLIKI